MWIDKMTSVWLRCTKPPAKAAPPRVCFFSSTERQTAESKTKKAKLRSIGQQGKVIRLGKREIDMDDRSGAFDCVRVLLEHSPSLCDWKSPLWTPLHDAVLGKRISKENSSFTLPLFLFLSFLFFFLLFTKKKSEKIEFMISNYLSIGSFLIL